MARFDSWPGHEPAALAGAKGATHGQERSDAPVLVGRGALAGAGGLVARGRLRLAAVVVMGTIGRARETRVLTRLLRVSGFSARDALDALNRVEADDDTWTQLRLWLAYTDDDDRVAMNFRVDVGRPREVVSAWGGVTVDLTLHAEPFAERLRVCVA